MKSLDQGGVFNVTAFDPNKVRHAYQEPKVFRSIIDVKPSDLNTKFIFTEVESNKALMMIGATTDDLVRMSEFEKQNIPGTPNIRQRIISDLEGRRLKTFAAAVEARNKLKKENQQPQKKATKGVKVVRKSDNSDFEKLKKKQINTLLSYQNQKERLRKSEEITAARIKETQKSRAAELEKKRVESIINYRKHFFRRPKNQDIEKLENERNEERQKENEQLQNLQNQLSNTPKKGQKQILDEINNLKSNIEKNENEFIEKLNYLKSAETQIKSLISPPEKITGNQLVDFKKREQERNLILKEKEILLMEQKKKLEKQILEKEAKVEANLRAITSQKMNQLKQYRIQLRKRSQSAAAAKKIIEQQKIAKFQKVMQREQEAYERAMKLKASKTTVIMEKAGETWMKQRNGLDNAKKIRVKKQFHVIEKVEKTIERQKAIEEEKEKIIQKQIKNLRKDTIKKVQQKEEYEELKRIVQNDPDSNPIELAKKYHVKINS
ncbi:hypothetical protein TRFO_25182 [Tritrichomonas foetus]|uniref:Uncharacterized protein n=1 Tax=Tritrichomonas foetus TaxID=1144522 RepID=A0A1J4K6Y2_9EUKA|nr:hypothetical protein TRFO_25182 [Tritrichomonas foetus]|eukprot:OHT06656.1 hypothetical protein TRFO_25182 [Tritrichomonas foetus]